MAVFSSSCSACGGAIFAVGRVLTAADMSCQTCGPPPATPLFGRERAATLVVIDGRPPGRSVARISARPFTPSEFAALERVLLRQLDGRRVAVEHPRRVPDLHVVDDDAFDDAFDDELEPFSWDELGRRIALALAPCPRICSECGPFVPRLQVPGETRHFGGSHHWLSEVRGFDQVLRVCKHCDAAILIDADEEE